MFLNDNNGVLQTIHDVFICSYYNAKVLYATKNDEAKRILRIMKEILVE